MDMTGWLQGQVFLQTVDDTEVEQVSAYLTARGVPFQLLTMSERMAVDAATPDAGVTNDRFSLAVQVAGFPQLVLPVLNELVQRVHGAGWDPEQTPPV